MIYIGVGGVTLDLNGFEIEHQRDHPAISIGLVNNATIENGSISGPFFATSTSISGPDANHVTVRNIKFTSKGAVQLGTNVSGACGCKVEACSISVVRGSTSFDAFHLGHGGEVSRCHVYSKDNHPDQKVDSGIRTGTGGHITNCHVNSLVCETAGIRASEGSLVRDCVVEGNSECQYGIFVNCGSLVESCSVSNNLLCTYGINLTGGRSKVHNCVVRNNSGLLDTIGIISSQSGSHVSNCLVGGHAGVEIEMSGGFTADNYTF